MSYNISTKGVDIVPTIIKRSYQYFYIASIIFITGLFAYFPDYIINGEDKIFNFIVKW